MPVSAIVWLSAAILLVVFEMVTVQLVSVWFAAAALIAMIFAFLDIPVWSQLLIFVAVSAVLLAATRSVVRRLMIRTKTPTNADRAIGQTVIALSDISLSTYGEVKINGLVWTAKAEGDFIIREGESALVTAIEGAKLIVSRASAPAAVS